MAQLTRITKRFVLLCEGQHDSEFFTHLLALHHLTNFEVCSANYVLGINHGGNTRFTEALDELVALPGFSTLEQILIVADNDLSPIDAFTYVVDQINNTAEIIDPIPHRFVAPAAPQVKAGANPILAILMIPWTGMVGSLDTMCLAAAANHNDVISECVDNFATCTHANEWPVTTQAKMKLRSLLSASWQANPYISPSYVWSRNTNLVPLADTIFDNVVNFLKAF